jgi:putative exporter of polyketide antibiotics
MNTRSKRVVFTALAVGVIAFEIRQRRKLVDKIIADTGSKASAYYGAMTLYGNLATYFGRKAMLAESEYWKVVNDG